MAGKWLQWVAAAASPLCQGPLFWPSAGREGEEDVNSDPDCLATTVVTMHNVLGDGVHEEKGVPRRQGGPVHLPVRPPLRQGAGGVPATSVPGQPKPRPHTYSQALPSPSRAGPRQRSLGAGCRVLPEGVPSGRPRVTRVKIGTQPPESVTSGLTLRQGQAQSPEPLVVPCPGRG